MALNSRYSFKDFMGQSFKARPASEFNNSTIKGSCFCQETSIDATLRSDIEKDIFPDGITGVIFERCNLDNVKIPAGNTIAPDSSHRFIQVQNDLEDWILDDVTLVPTQPMNANDFTEFGISVNPADIPVGRLTRSRTKTARRGPP